jgi:hypothetical protein
LAKIGLIHYINKAVISIDLGRKGLATADKEKEGRINYETGIANAMAAFTKAQASADPQTLMLAEFAFISQELQFCGKFATETITSLNKAVASFKDALLSLQAVEESCYKITEKTFPHDKDHRVCGFPNDSFHIAVKGHQTRLKNILKTPGLNPIEVKLLKQRYSNLTTAQNSYMEKQRKAFQ